MASAVREMPGLVSIPVPDALKVGPVYDFAILSERRESARLAPLQKIPSGGGLLPVIDVRPH